MGVSILEGREGGLYGGGTTRAVWFCNTSGVAFGPVWWSLEEAAAIQAHVNYRLNRDVRSLEDGEAATIAQRLVEERGEDWFESGDWDDEDQFCGDEDEDEEDES